MPVTSFSPTDISFSEIAEQFLEMCRAGETPSIREFATQYPKYAEDISEEFPAILLAERLKDSQPREEDDTFDVPTTLAGYRIKAELGRGGMGRVYSAEHGLWKREVAIKVISLRHNVRPGLVARFRREARAAGNLKHSNIVSVLDYGTEGDLAYIVMPRIKGHTLVRVIDELARSSSSLQDGTPLEMDWAILADIGSQASSALSYAHQRGLVHRDIKPGNLMVDKAGKVFVMDFGLVKVHENRDSLSCTGDVIGTPRYMPPEQFRGFCDGRSDIYGLGLTLYELACGKRVWDFLSSEHFLRNRSNLALPQVSEINPSIPETLNQIIMKCCEFDPDDRYQSATELKFVLDRFLKGMPIADRRRMKNRNRVWYRRRSFLALVITIAAFLIGGAAYGLFSFLMPPDPFENPKIALKVLQDEEVRAEFIKELPGLIDEVVTSNDPNFRKVMGNLAQRSAEETVDSYDISPEEKAKIKKNVDKWVKSYERGELSNEKLGAIWSNMADSSVATAMRFNRIYVQVFQSDLGIAEKQDAENWMVLLRQAIVEKRLSQEAIGRLMDRIQTFEQSTGKEVGITEYPPLTLAQLRDFLALVKHELQAIGGYVQNVQPQDLQVADKIEASFEAALKDPAVHQLLNRMPGKVPSRSEWGPVLQRLDKLRKEGSR